MFVAMNVSSMNTEPGPPENYSCKNRSCADVVTRVLRRCRSPSPSRRSRRCPNSVERLLIRRIDAPTSTETVMSGPSQCAQTVKMNVVSAGPTVPSLPALHSASLCTPASGTCMWCLPLQRSCHAAPTDRMLHYGGGRRTQGGELVSACGTRLESACRQAQAPA